MSVKVIKQVKVKKTMQIQSASRIINEFMSNLSISMKNPSIKTFTLSYLQKKINKIYLKFFNAVKANRERTTIKLFIYLYRSICNELGTDSISQADDQFRRIAKSVLQYQSNSRAKLFSAFLGLKSNLDTDSFQIFYELCQFVKSK